VKHLDIYKVLEILPHRYPFLLVDRVVEFVAGESLTALKNVTYNEPYFNGHFPYRPIMPGVLVLEAMVQSCAILASLTVDQKVSDRRIYYFVGVDNARFKRPVEPGDQLIMRVQLERRLKGMWKCSAEATVDENLCCRAGFMFTHKEI